MKPRVVLVAHGVHDDGGMERACAELVRRAHQEFDFIVISAELDPALRTLVKRWIRIRVPMRPIPLKFVLFWLQAGLRVRLTRADLVHTVGALIPNRVDVASIHFCHAGYLRAVRRLAPASAPLPRRINTSIAHFLALLAERWSYRRGRLRAFAAVSRGVCQELRDNYPGIEVRLTPNGVDTDRFHPDPDARAELRAAAGVDGGTVAAFIGSDWHWKGLPLVLSALAEVRQRGVDMRLWVLGTGDRRRFGTLAESLSLGPAVSFCGFRSDTERVLAAADLFVLPSLYETFSLVALEAAATGLPVVVTPVHGIGDMVRDENAGVVVERRTSSIAGALLTLGRDRRLREKLGAHALSASRAYSWGSSAGSMIKLYRSLLC